MMSKSTPINQLPGQAMPPQGNFINDSQRQMVSGAQAAIGAIGMPQNTQLGGAEFGDDDAEIQEALNDVNAQISSPGPQMNSIPNIPIENPSDLMFMQGAQYQMPSPQQQQAPPPVAMQAPPAMAMPAPAASVKPGQMSFNDYLTRFGDDLKLAGVIFLAIIAVHFVPFESLIGKYIALDKIPYHDILIRAFVVAALVVTVKQFI